MEPRVTYYVGRYVKVGIASHNRSKKGPSRVGRRSAPQRYWEQQHREPVITRSFHELPFRRKLTRKFRNLIRHASSKFYARTKICFDSICWLLSLTSARSGCKESRRHHKPLGNSPYRSNGSGFDFGAVAVSASRLRPCYPGSWGPACSAMVPLRCWPAPESKSQV